MEFRHPYDPATGLPGDGTAPWQNGDPAAGIDGSIPPAEAFNDPQREIVNVIDAVLGDGTFGSGQSVGDLTQLLQAIRLLGVPTGMLSPFAGDAAPAGWLFADGSLVLRAAYPDLWTHAQASGMLDGAGLEVGQFGPGDGSTTFKLPDIRGRFVRALDSGAGIDAGRLIGTFQDQEIQNHGHIMETIIRGVFDSTGGPSGYGQDTGSPGDDVTIADYAGAADETRPANYAYPWIIKV